MTKPSGLELLYFEDGGLSHIVLIYDNYELIIDVLQGTFYDFYLN